MSGDKQQVHSVINVGAYIEPYEADFEELGAIMKTRPVIRVAQPVLNRLDSRTNALKAQASRNPALAQALRPVIKMASSATTTARAALNAAAAQRVKTQADFLNQPTHVIPVCFDAVGPAAQSGTATIKAPHNNPWRLLSIQTNDAECVGMRVTSFVLAGTEHVVTSNVTFDSGGPTFPGIDLATFSHRMNTVVLAQHRYRPWGLGKGGVLRADGEIKIRLYNPGAGPANANITLFVQSTPCGENSIYISDKGGVLPGSAKGSKEFFARLMAGQMTYWPQAA